MDSNENHSQDFTNQGEGYTPAPGSPAYQTGETESQPQSGGQYSGPQYSNPQYNGQYNGQFNGGQGYVPPQQNEPKGYAIAGMVLGIVSIVCCCSPYIGIGAGVLALVFSIIVLSQNRAGRGMAIAGVICGAIGLLLAIGMIILGVGMQDYLNSGRFDALLRDIEQSNDYY